MSMNSSENGRYIGEGERSRLWAIHHAKNKLEMRTDEITPDDQVPDWLKAGIKELEDGKTPSLETIRSSDRSGGKSDPDPWFT